MLPLNITLAWSQHPESNRVHSRTEGVLDHLSYAGVGARSRSRTDNPPFTKRPRCQLRYPGTGGASQCRTDASCLRGR
jgi:hypothetical protein